MDPVRSLLYVPGNNREWVYKAPFKYTNADGIIFDLEDAVPPTEKDTARKIVRQALETFNNVDATLLVRINDPDSEEFEKDMKSIVHSNLDVILSGKVRKGIQIQKIDHILSYLEQTRNIEKTIEIMGLPETAMGLQHPYEIITSSERMTSITCGSAPGGDINHDLGFKWTQEGLESLYFQSRVLLAARAGGISEILSAGWLDVENIDGLRRHAQFSKQLGFTGYQVIHPSHIEPINEIFSPNPEKVKYYQKIINEMDNHEEDGKGAIRVDGQMVDQAHVRTARRYLARARAFNIIN